jgi:formate dehydrogenase major subunit
MKIDRRKFLKVTLGTVGTAVVAEAAGLGLNTSRAQEKAAGIPMKTGKQTPSICSYCSVGCGTIVMTNDAGKIIDIQGNPDSPLSEGTLCPKGAAEYQLVDNDQRWTKVKYRAPGSDHWEDKSLDWAMEQIADRVKKTRDANFNEFADMPDGKGGTVKKKVMNTYSIASLGGALLDNEWNYAHTKLLRSLGVLYIENQARI